MSALVEAFARAQGPGDFGRARIDLQRLGTPQEVLDAALLADRMPPHAAEWVRRLAEYCLAERADAAAFHRTSEDPGWTLYRGAGEERSTELVIGFAGGAGNLFQPAPVVLQQLDPARHHLLLLRDAARARFLDGAGPHHTFDELIAALGILGERYASMLVLGASSGGAPAVLAGLRLGARRAVALGGHLDGTEAAQPYLGSSPRSDVVAGPSGDHPRTELWSVFGAGCVRDRQGSAGIADALPHVRRIAIAGIDTHSFPHACFQRGTSGALYDLLLGDASRPGPTGEAGADGVLTIELDRRFTPPEWADPVGAPTVWLSNTIRIPERLRRAIIRVPLPARLAAWIERTAYERLGIAMHLRRARNRQRRAAPRA